MNHAHDQNRCSRYDKRGGNDKMLIWDLPIWQSIGRQPG